VLSGSPWVFSFSWCSLPSGCGRIPVCPFSWRGLCWPFFFQSFPLRGASSPGGPVPLTSTARTRFCVVSGYSVSSPSRCRRFFSALLVARSSSLFCRFPRGVVCPQRLMGKMAARSSFASSIVAAFPFSPPATDWAIRDPTASSAFGEAVTSLRRLARSRPRNPPLAGKGADPHPPPRPKFLGS